MLSKKKSIICRFHWELYFETLLSKIKLYIEGGLKHWKQCDVELFLSKKVSKRWSWVRIETSGKATLDMANISNNKFFILFYWLFILWFGNQNVDYGGSNSRFMWHFIHWEEQETLFHLPCEIGNNLKYLSEVFCTTKVSII